jgi:hypothetical protein
LGKRLSRLLMIHIRACLPRLKKKINDKTLEYQELMNGYGKSVVDESQTLIEILTRFATAYGAVINGQPKHQNSGETKLFKIIHREFNEAIINNICDISFKCLKKVAIPDSAGPRPILFNTPSFDVPFEEIVKKQIEQLREPSLDCVEKVRKEMEKNVKYCGDEVKQDMQRFPMLHQKIKEVVAKMLRQRMEATNEKIVELIDTELSYVNILHPDFDQSKILNELLMKELKKQGIVKEEEFSSHTFPVLGREMTAKEKEEILENLINEYFGIVSKSVQDLVPKTIVYQLVSYVKNNIQSQLLKDIYKPDFDGKLLSEARNIELGRKHSSEMLLVSLNAILL